jgi:hypothetical protein
MPMMEETEETSKLYLYMHQVKNKEAHGRVGKVRLLVRYTEDMQEAKEYLDTVCEALPTRSLQ